MAVESSRTDGRTRLPRASAPTKMNSDSYGQTKSRLAHKSPKPPGKKEEVGSKMAENKKEPERLWRLRQQTRVDREGKYNIKVNSN